MLEKLLTNPESIGVTVLLLAAVAAYTRGWVVPGYMYVQVLKERDEFRSMAWRALELSKRTVDVVVQKDNTP